MLDSPGGKFTSSSLPMLGTVQPLSSGKSQYPCEDDVSCRCAPEEGLQGTEGMAGRPTVAPPSRTGEVLACDRRGGVCGGRRSVWCD